MMMRNIKKIFDWISNNKQWVFSGIGITILSVFFSLLINFMRVSDASDNSAVPATYIEDHIEKIDNHIENNGVIYQDNIFNNDSGNTNVYQTIEDEISIEIDGSFVYPISIDIIEEWKINKWVYFRYMLEERNDDYTLAYPVLFRYQVGEHIAKRVNQNACYRFEIVGDCVYYLNSQEEFQDHGELYVSRLDGKNEKLLEEELYDFQIVDERYIYYTYCYDTIGVGLENHAMHRMNLDGSEIMIVAYEVLGLDIGTSHFNYKVEDGWIDCGDFKMAIGEPANGLEKIVFKENWDNGWVYYTTNRLLKARKDGSDIVELDGVEDYYYCIEKIEDDWIYYVKGIERYKIRTDGSGKEFLGKD